MTRGEALKKMQAVKSYMTSGNPIWSVTEIGEAFDMAIEALEQPERKKGKWIQKSKPMEFCTAWWYECSECGDKPPRDRYGNPDYLSNYCPNCGADMRGEDA